MAAAVILDFQKFEILTVGLLEGAKMRHRATFCQNWSNGCGDIKTVVITVFQNSGCLPSWIFWTHI